MAMSPADRQVEAHEDVERIASELHNVAHERTGSRWDGLAEHNREHLRSVVRNLLRRDVIRVGHRPSVERPMAGQLSIEEPVHSD